MVQDEPDEEFEPLFDYSRVQPADVIFLDDDDSDSLALLPAAKRRKFADPPSGKGQMDGTVVVLADDDHDGKGKHDDEDWLPPPPPKTPRSGLVLEDKTLQELRLQKQELASLAQSAEDVLREVMESAKRELNSSLKNVPEFEETEPSKPTQPARPPVKRQKIIISIQGKDGQKQFRVYMDDKLERLFKMYADKAKLALESLVFCFDGEKVSATATPESLGMEEDDIIEVHVKSH